MKTNGRSKALVIHNATTLASAAALVAIVSVVAGCTGNPSAGSPAYKAGELGNGGFLFNCDDSVACDRWTTNNAKDFPDIVATGGLQRSLRRERRSDERGPHAEQPEVQRRDRDADRAVHEQRA